MMMFLVHDCLDAPCLLGPPVLEHVEPLITLQLGDKRLLFHANGLL